MKYSIEVGCYRDNKFVDGQLSYSDIETDNVDEAIAYLRNKMSSLYRHYDYIAWKITDKSGNEIAKNYT